MTGDELRTFYRGRVAPCIRITSMTGFVVFGAAFATLWMVTVAIGGPLRHRPPIQRVGTHTPGRAGSELRVLTLNLAHGRGNRVVQRLTSREQAVDNLNAVAGLIARQDPHVVAFQEADVDAFWSGGFNHLEHVASRAGMCRYAQAPSVNGFGLRYGTGLLAATEMRAAFAGTFAPSPPTFPKGWIAGLVPWEASATGWVCVVSVHLDFSRRIHRQRQLAQLAGALKEIPHPLVVMGDFNCEIGADPALLGLLRELNLHAHRAAEPGAATFPLSGKRLDWILLSRGLRFMRHEVVEEPVSDHYAVTAVIAPELNGRFAR